MAANKTAIAKMALRHLGITLAISDVDTGVSKEEVVMREFYTDALEQCFRDFPWPFALRSVALVEVAAQPTAEWAYSYRYPATALRIHRIISDVWPETIDSRIPFRILSDTTGRLIYTNKEDAEVEYVVAETTVTKWTPDFTNAFAYLWASLIAASVTGGDQHKLGDRALRHYLVLIDNAMVNAGNEDVPVPEAESRFITARD